jgi:hypothetical protein
MKVSVSKLNKRSPEHQLYAQAWEDCDILASGGIRLKNAAVSFLARAPKELYDVWAERVKRMTYQPILSTIIGWYTAQLWRRNPEIVIRPAGNATTPSGAATPGAAIQPAAYDKWYDSFLTNCDRAGTSYNDFHRQTFRSMLMYGRAWVLTDLPKASAPPANRAEEQEAGLDQPYVIAYSPHDVPNWGVDETGNLDWCVIKAITDNRTFLGDEGPVVRWYYFDRRNYQVFEWRGTEQVVSERDANGFLSKTYMRLLDPSGNAIMAEDATAELVDEGTHALAGMNRVPVRRITVPDELWLANRAYLQLIDHLNQDNSLAWGLFMGNIPMPIVFSDGDPGPLTISQVGFLQFGQADKFEWAAPPAASYELSQRRLESLREEIYRSFYLQAQGRSSSASASSQSGYSKEMDMMPANEILNGFGDKLIKAMQDVFADVVAARGDGDKITLDVSGFTFETKPITESIAVAEEMQDLGIFADSKTLEKEAKIRVATDFLEDRNDGVKQQVIQEIRNSRTIAERQQQQQEQDAAAQTQAFQMSFNKLQSRGEVHDELAATH